MLPNQKSNVPMIALLVISLLVAESGIAAVRGEVPSTIVRYLLNSPEGIAGLYERIQADTVEVCRWMLRSATRYSSGARPRSANA
jgi:hypothetical protein